MANHEVSTCDLCGVSWDKRFVNPGFKVYSFWVGEVHDGCDRWEDDYEAILLCQKCQARVAKALNGKGKIDEALPGEGGEAILEKTLLPGG